jgi:FtsP/CotA-like multicopper oxidase with cupredoxin domain
MTMGMSGMDMGGMDHGSMMGGSSSMTHTMPDGTMMDMDGTTITSETAGIEWSDTGMTMKDPVDWQLVDNDTNKVNQAVNWTFKKGDAVLVTVTNSSQSMHPMQHQLHFHGQRFAVITKNGQASKDLEWKDTVTVPSGQTYELLVSMENPGEWMAHCHISEHLSAGMAINFKVEE